MPKKHSDIATAKTILSKFVHERRTTLGGQDKADLVAALLPLYQILTRHWTTTFDFPRIEQVRDALVQKVGTEMAKSFAVAWEDFAKAHLTDILEERLVREVEVREQLGAAKGV